MRASRSGAMRILMTADAVGGVWTFATTLARTLAEAGATIRIVTLGPRPSASQLSEASAERISVEMTDLALEWQDPAGSDRCRAERTLLRAARDFAPDIVHLSSYRDATCQWPAPVVLTAHSCVSTWAQACGETGLLEDPDWCRYAVAVHDGLEAATAWTAPTAAFREAVAATHRVARRGIVIPNGTDVRPQPPHVRRKQVLAAGRTGDKAKNIACVARLARRIDWPVCIAGEAKTPQSSAARYLGRLPRSTLLTRMRQSAVFISPALYEPFGLSVLEAASSGCALALADIPSFRENWQGAACFFDPHDDHEAERCLRAICLDDVLRHTLQDAARRRSQAYAVERTGAAYLALFQKLAQRGSAMPADPKVAQGALA